MDFDKNTVIGIVLILLIFLGFTFYTKQQEEAYLKAHPKQTEQSSKYPGADSAAAVAKAGTDTAKQEQNTAKVSDSSALISATGSFAPFMNGKEQLVTIENENCIFTFSNKGGTIKKVELKDYKKFIESQCIDWYRNVIKSSCL